MAHLCFDGLIGNDGIWMCLGMSYFMLPKSNYMYFVQVNKIKADQISMKCNKIQHSIRINLT